MKEFEYKQYGTESANCNPPLPQYLVELGMDGSGKMWLCKITPANTLRHLQWHVDFDTNDEYKVKADPEWETDESYDYSSPFLRPEVVYARNYAEMNRIRYHRKTVEYIDIRKTISEFVEMNGIK